MIVFILITFAIVLTVLILLLFNTDKVVTILKLDEGFESDKFDLGNLNDKTIVKLSSIIIGATTIIDSLPSFISYTLYAFKQDVIGVNIEANDKFFWIGSLIQILMGLYLVFSYKQIEKLVLNTTK